MRPVRHFIILFYIVIFPSVFVHSQHQGNAGRDFWLTSSVVPASGIYPPENYSFYYTDAYPDSAIIYIVGKYACTGYVENPNTNFHIDFSITPYTILEIRVPENEIMCDFSEGIQQRGIFLHSECDVYVYLQSNLSDVGIQSCEHHVITPCIFTTLIAVSPVELFNHEVFFTERHYTCGKVIATADSTEITVWEDYSQGTVETSWLLQRGEVLNLPHIIYGIEECPRKVSSNCKILVSYNSHLIFSSDQHNNGSDYSHYFLRQINFRQLSGQSFILPEILELKTKSRSYFHSSYGYAPGRIYGDEANFSLPQECYYGMIQTYPENSPLSHTFGSYFIYPYPAYMGETHFKHNYWSGETHDLHTELIVLNALPAERRVREAIFVTPRDLPSGIDTLYSELAIIVSPDGISSTCVNDSLLPDTLFRTLPGIENQYYFAQIAYWNDNTSDLIKIENPLGFTATYTVLGYTVRPYENIYTHVVEEGRIPKFRSQLNSGGVASYLDEYDIAPVRCIGDTLLLYATNNYDHYSTDWLINGVEYLNRDTVSLLVQDSGELDIRLIIHTDCPDTLYRTIQIEIPPIISYLASDTSLCPGESVRVTSPNATHYRWSHGREGASVSFPETGTYTVTASNSCYIEAIDTIHVFVYPPLQVDLGSDTTLCTLLPLLLDASNPHAISYLWQDQSTNATYTVMYDGDYWVIVTDPCTGRSDTVNVLYLEPVSLNLGNDTTLCDGEILLLNVHSPYCDYLWQDGSADSLYRVSSAGEYSVFVSNLCFGGRDTILVLYESCDLTLYIPNSFTPDGDGINDLFKPQFNHPEYLRDYVLYIYDRWGGLHFRSTNPETGWDARNSHPGVYIYLIEYQGEIGGKKIAKGSVTVVKK